MLVFLTMIVSIYVYKEEFLNKDTTKKLKFVLPKSYDYSLDNILDEMTAGKGDNDTKPSPRPMATSGKKLMPDNKWISGSEWRKLNVNTIKWVQQDFIYKHLDAARFLSDTTGVPVSFILAQAMTESRYGRSRLAVTANNYFGVKWTGKKRGVSTYVIANDDSPTDRFRKYDTKWWAYFNQISVYDKYIKRIDGEITVNTFLMAICRLDKDLKFRKKLRKGEDSRYYASSCDKCNSKGMSQYAYIIKSMIKRFNLEQYDR